jgi:hypothetical protein
VSLEVSVPSLTVTVIVAVPDCDATGVMETVRLFPLPPKTMAELGTSVVFEEEPVTARLPAAVSASLTVKANAPVDVPAEMVRFEISLMSGALFDELGTATVKTFV